MTPNEFKLIQCIITDYLYLYINESKKHLPLSPETKQEIRDILSLDQLFDKYYKLFSEEDLL